MKPRILATKKRINQSLCVNGNFNICTDCIQNKREKSDLVLVISFCIKTTLRCQINPLILISLSSRSLTCTSSPVPILFGELVKNLYLKLHMKLFPFLFKPSSTLESNSQYFRRRFVYLAD